MVDFFITTNLLESLSWSIALATNINLSSNSLTWADTISASGYPRFYDVWTLDDTDGDTLSDGREVRMHGTDENDADTDDDGLDDGEEIFTYETNPLDSDTDADGLNDGSEVNQYYTDPLNSDSDGDGNLDGAEINNGANPLFPDFKVTSASEDQVISDSMRVIITQYTGEITVTVVIFSEEYPDYTEDQSEYNDEVSYTIVSPNGTLDSQTYNVNSLHSSFVKNDNSMGVYTSYVAVLDYSALTSGGSSWLDISGSAVNIGDSGWDSGVYVTVRFVDVDLDADFNHDGIIDSSDPGDPEEHTSPGLLVALNDDDDDNLNGTADKDEIGPIVDGDGSGPQTNENDLVKVHLGLLPNGIDYGKVIFVATHPIDAGHIKVWSSPTKGAGNLILDTTTGGDDWKNEWLLGSSTSLGDIPEAYYVEGVASSEGGQISLVLKYETQIGTTLLQDTIKITVITPELDVGETARPANRIGLDDPRAVDNAKNKLVVWSTDYIANKTEYDLLKYSDIGGAFYKITQAQGWNTGYPLEDTLTVDSSTINPEHDSDDTSWDFKVWYGSFAANREDIGPYEIYAVSEEDYDDARDEYDNFLILLTQWADTVYKRFYNGSWPTGIWNPTDCSGTITFPADQSSENVPYADITHKFGGSFTVESSAIINGRRYPVSRVTVPVYYWSTNTPLNDLFRTDGRSGITSGIGQAALLRFDVVGVVSNITEVIVDKL